MPFLYSRPVRLADTDAAGVVYFANVLNLCHEAYEEALGTAGIVLGSIIADFGVILPIARCSCDFLLPLVWGDRVRVHLSVQQLRAPQSGSLRERSFELIYHVYLLGDSPTLAATASTCHVCLDAATRQKQAIPDAIAEVLRSLG